MGEDFDTQAPFEELGEHNGLRKLQRTPRHGTHDWCLTGEEGAVQLTGYAASADFDDAWRERLERLRMGWDFGIHHHPPADFPTRALDHRDCPLIPDGRCVFEVNGAMGWQAHELIEAHVEEGVPFDEAVWPVLEAIYQSRLREEVPWRS